MQGCARIMAAVPSPVAHYEGQDLEALADIPRYQDWVLEPFRPHLRGRVLEVGAGIGNLSARYVDNVAEAVLVEPAQNLAGRLQSAFAKYPHVRTVAAPLDAVASEFTPNSFDACILVNVLEHVEADLAMLLTLHRLIKPSGILLIHVPALPILYGSLDALVQHHRRYTRTSLRRVVEGASFAIRELRYSDVLGVLPWFVAGRILRRPRFDPGAARLYDRFFVPVGARLERLFSPPLGKNLTCIAEPVAKKE